MDPKLKQYADSLYEQSRFDASQKAQQERREFLHQRAAQTLEARVRPLSGFDIQTLVDIQTRLIEFGMTARLDSYEKAYGEADRTPIQEEFNTILMECQAVRSLMVEQATTALRQFIASHGGGVPFVPDKAYVEAGSAHGHDRVLRKWKTWRARAELTPVDPKTPFPKKAIDALMPIYNRTEFERDFAELTKSAESPCSLLFMDLDKFKSINDGPGGHQAGDRALKAFGETVLAVAKGRGSAYRFGGDEVCVILPNHTEAEAVAVAERIRREVRAVKASEYPDGLSSSIGVASFPESTSDASKLCSDADVAMYKSKKGGGNRVSIAGEG